VNMMEEIFFIGDLKYGLPWFPKLTNKPKKSINK
jgi:hypothetical protein